jgi:hypothetical protein
MRAIYIALSLVVSLTDSKVQTNYIKTRLQVCDDK